MPIFDYRCAACGERTEHILLAGETAPAACAVCGGALKRAWGGYRIGVNLQGWGFSRNDRLFPDDRPRKDWRALKERADQIRDE